MGWFDIHALNGYTSGEVQTSRREKQLYEDCIDSGLDGTRRKLFKQKHAELHGLISFFVSFPLVINDPIPSHRNNLNNRPLKFNETWR